jgi:peptidyl-dipeptidase A
LRNCEINFKLNYNYRTSFQGLEPPVARSENDFDPGAKYHTASFTPYARFIFMIIIIIQIIDSVNSNISFNRYFISHFLQFQFYKSLCDLAGHKGPYHKCDFYNSQVAGKRFKYAFDHKILVFF